MKPRQYLPLAVIGVVSTACCVLAWNLSKAAVAERKASQVTAIIDRTMPVRYDNVPHRDAVELPAAAAFGSPQPRLRAYPLRQQGETLGVVLLPVLVRGYYDDIALAVGIDSDGAVAGISVMSHQETAGIGAAAMQPAYTDAIIGKSLQSPQLAAWAVRREGGDFDQVSGATISSSAVVRAVRDSLKLYAAEQDRLGR